MTTHAERAQFERDGYLIFDPGVPLTTLDAITAELKDRFEWRVTNGVLKRVGRIQDAWKFSGHVRDLATAPRVLAMLEAFYGRKPLPFQTLNFPTGTEQHVHSDTVHFNSQPAGFMCGVWVALEDIDRDNGPLEYYPGSHKLPEITIEDVDRAGYVKHSSFDRFKAAVQDVLHANRPGRRYGEFVYRSYETFMGDLLKQLGIEPHYATIKKGQALLWAANLLHGGSPQRDQRRTRFSQVTHYYFEGCRYYTPRLSRGRKLAWRKIEVIR
ncbi:MAG TPA: phytanoyl-CoA dioxygenase family protein [Isosphaeraceae bacterium]|nr:phytanoyl-CoA dioxygenase family protein [Isosphaeraceae bacterium]